MLSRLFTFLLPMALAACLHSETTAADPVALGIDLGASGPANPRGGEGHPGSAAPNRPMQMAHEGHNDVHGTGVVKAVDPAQHKVTLSHQPISQIGWPAMTMEFAVAPAVDLNTVKPENRIDFSMEQGQGGMYVIQSIKPAGGGR
ncbi:MAG TPA: copper-binding protein [Alphaproteobacteria bacterium]